MHIEIQPLLKKVALVTGRLRGIGAAIVRRLAKDGATVAFTYSTSPARAEEVVSEVQTSGGRAWLSARMSDELI